VKYVVAVRPLCEFTARSGDLDRRFMAAPSAVEGMAGHRAVVATRGPAYESEIALSGTHGLVTVRGRADGHDSSARRLEEIKTHRGDVARITAHQRALHWAQAKVYGHLLCAARDLAALDVALVYFEVSSGRETVLVERYSAAELEDFFVTQCERFAAWAARELEHRQARDLVLETLQFPYGEFRAGQREFSKAIYRAARNSHCVLLQAPTGIGKTMAALFPMLKACGTSLDKVFFLCAKTMGRVAALEALAHVRKSAPALRLRVLELVAREQVCEHPGAACHGEACPLARGFHDRLPAARGEAVELGWLDRAAVRDVALAHGICPYYLGQELVRWADVVVGDYNYYFDSNGALYGAMLSDGWRVGVLVDEAHNMVERARRMYSAELRTADLGVATAQAPKALRPPLSRLARSLAQIAAAQEAGYRAHQQVPQSMMSHVESAVTALSEHFVDEAEPAEKQLLQCYFDLLAFQRLAENLGDHSIFDVSVTGNDAAFCIRNVVPAPFIGRRIAAAQGIALFSATLDPMAYYTAMLGLPQDCAQAKIPGPFRAEQLDVCLVGDVSTRYHHRLESLGAVVAMMARAYRARPGNYLCFSSSYEYTRRLEARMRMDHDGIPVWGQAPDMGAQEREDFLARFARGGRGIGFVVLGGAFGEGVDLPGDRLIGAFILTLGLPQVNAVNEEMKRLMQARFGEGYNYAYLYPGLQKVVQAAGRVIRSETDVGSVYLVDDRFQRARVRSLLPEWWRVRMLSSSPQARD
jgi:DNA excision repair protein ERCC-2